MRMVDELKHMILYSAKNEFYAPVNKSDKRHGSAILLLTPNMESSIALSKTNVMYNSNLFTSFYIDRNVTAYIDSVNPADIVKDFEQEDAEKLSEAMESLEIPSTRFEYDPDASIISRKHAEEFLNKSNAVKCMKTIGIYKLPKIFKVQIHPLVSDLRNSAPSNIANTFNDVLYSYTDKNTIHIIPKAIYDDQIMGGTYEIYCLTELYCAVIQNINPDLSPICVKGIASVLSGQNDWIRKGSNGSTLRMTDYNRFAKIIKTIRDEGKWRDVIDFINTGDVNIFNYKFTKTSIINNIKIMTGLIFEADMSYAERQKLMPSEFGIPSKRKYPLNDKDHVRAAVRMFNHCDKDDEKELAVAIVKAIKKFGMEDEIEVGEKNRLSKYYTSKKKPVNESYAFNVYDDNPDEEDKYEAVKTICNSLSKEEMSKISLYDEYRDSKFVIKRIIHKIDYEPAGFLDVYLFPSNPDVAMITIAVDSGFRGMGVGDSLVKELLSSNLHEEYGFKVYLWTAHEDNEASQNLAMKHGFTNTNTYDRLGRKRLIKVMKNVDKDMTLRDVNKNIYHSNKDDSMLVTESMAMVFEADGPNYSDKLKRYLYKERIRNNTEVLAIYDKVKMLNPEIKKTYPRLEQYKGFNIFVDLSYYHAIFMNNNNFRAETALNYYVEFLDRLLNNTEISKVYPKQTLFIPVSNKLWAKTPGADITDFHDGINPISLIFRLIRTNLSALRKAFRNKTVIFIGDRGYFKVDFSILDLVNLPKLKANISKLCSNEEVVDDDKEIVNNKVDSTEAMAAKMINKIERNTSINIDNIKARPATSADFTYDHLTISKNKLSITPADTVLISIDPDGAKAFTKNDNDMAISNVSNLNSFYSID